jgi:hypothetical protein
MGDLSPTASAVELPDVRSYAAQRRHRPLTGTAGILLFACLFLPALKGCGETTVMPLELPPFVPPYLYGLVFAFAARARSQRALVASVVMLRLLATLVACSGFVVFLVAPSVGIVELSIGVVLLAAAGARGYSERRLAWTAAIMGAVCTLWFGLWAFTADALAGVYLSLGSSVALLAGGLVWWFEVTRCPSPPPGPHAVAFAVSSSHEGFALRTAAVRRRL